MESNFFKKFKAIASLPIFRPYFSFFLKRLFKISSKPGKPGNGNLVLITSTVQVELSKLNFEFDDIGTYFLQVLRDCQQITFITLNVLCLLGKKNTLHVLIGQYGQNTIQNFYIF